MELLGFRDAWRGVLELDWEPVTVERCRGTLPRGGTILGTSRVSPHQSDDGVERVRQVMEELDLAGFIVIGGNGSLSAAEQLTREGVPCVGVPKTIDNDIVGTDVSVGFDTATHVASAAIDRLHTTAEAHDRVLVVEVMGRHAGHIALRSGLAGGAAMTLIPEVPFDIDEICDRIVRRHHGPRWATIVCVAEGALPVPGTIAMPEYHVDQFGHHVLGGISTLIAPVIEQRTGYETRVTILGHVQRGGTPTAFDRYLGTRLGISAVEMVRDGAWGQMAAASGDDIARVPLSEMAGLVKTVPHNQYEASRLFWP
jgi:6-phosphofructokinase